MKFKLILFLFFIGLSAYAQNDSLKNIDALARQIKHELQGKKAIDLKARTIDDKLINLADYKGKVILLNFWFIGCPPCMGEIPDLNKIDSTYKNSDFVLISLAKDDSARVKKFLSSIQSKQIQKINYPIITNSNTIEKLYNIVSHPTSILIDKKGTIRLFNEGASLESLNKYVELYGEKKLSKGWRKIYNESKDTKSISVYQTFSLFINELLSE